MGIRSNSWFFVSEKVLFSAKNIILCNPRFWWWIGEWCFDVKFINSRPSKCIIYEDRCDFGPPLYTHIDPDTVFFCWGVPQFFSKGFLKTRNWLVPAFDDDIAGAFSIHRFGCFALQSFGGVW